jgi:hypothetical protein
MALEKEIRFFEQHQKEWFEQHPYKYALVFGEELVDVFDTVERALQEGINRFGTNQFLVRQIEKTAPTLQMNPLSLGIARAHIQ